MWRGPEICCSKKSLTLNFLASKGHVDCVQILITSGAKLNIRDKVDLNG